MDDDDERKLIFIELFEVIESDHRIDYRVESWTPAPWSVSISIEGNRWFRAFFNLHNSHF